MLSNIELNADKSGILEITPKRVKTTMQVGSKFEGIPVVEEYKYLGLLMDNKLSGENHARKLFGWRDENGKKHQGKIDFIKYNLNPLIRHISLEYKVNLWQTLIRPLFIPLAMLGNFMCESMRLDIERKLKKCLKMFIGLKKTVPDDVLFYMVKVNFNEWAKNEKEKAELKWKARMERKEVGELPKYVIKCLVKFLPKEIAELVNLQRAYCGECQTIMNSAHYALHGVQVPNVFDLLGMLERKIEDMVEVNEENDKKRESIIEELACEVRIINDKMKLCLQKIGKER